MSWLTEHQRLIGRCAWVAAWVGLVVGQLHALSRFATAEGAEDLALPATAAWAVPAAEALSPLLGWGDADLVYVTYGKIWFPLFLAFTLVQVSEVVDGLGRRPVNGRAGRPNGRQCVDRLGPRRRLYLQPGPIVLESEGEEVPDLKDRRVEHTALLAVRLDVRR
jgi:hypothetical protein